MESPQVAQRHEPWNKHKLIGQKLPFKLKEIWAIRVRLQSSSGCGAALWAYHPTSFSRSTRP